MLKQILNLTGAQELSKNSQKSIVGGGPLQASCGGNCNVSGCDTGKICVQVFCGPNGPFSGLEKGWTCVNAGGNK